MNRTMKTKNRIFAICMAVPARMPKPKTAAISAITRNVMAQFNIGFKVRFGLFTKMIDEPWYLPSGSQVAEFHCRTCFSRTLARHRYDPTQRTSFFWRILFGTIPDFPEDFLQDVFLLLRIANDATNRREQQFLMPIIQPRERFLIAFLDQAHQNFISGTRNGCDGSGRSGLENENGFFHE
jgi:hypothetical protein